jgi:hypothetical protein
MRTILMSPTSGRAVAHSSADRAARIGRACSALLACGALAMAAQLITASPASAAQPEPTPEQRAAMLKEWLAASRASLRTYQWVETTTVSKDGAQKSQKQATCFYGPDGTLQKVPIDVGGQPQDAGRDPVLGRRMREAAKQDAVDYIQSAVQLVHAYVPPDPAQLQQSVAAGKLSVSVLAPGQSVQLNFSDYLKPGDLLSARIATQTNQLLGLGVASYLDTPANAVQLDVTMGLLADGTIYEAQSVLNAPAQGLTVTVANSDYRKLGQ